MFVVAVAVAVTIAITAHVIVVVIAAVSLNRSYLIAAHLLPRAGTCQALYD